jgi:hypothetical protein
MQRQTSNRGAPIMFDSPKAGHFICRINGNEATGPDALRFRWRVADAIRNAGVCCLLNPNADDRRLIGLILKKANDDLREGCSIELRTPFAE